ncbi:hypothetical protein A33M_0030 [Rhodovulum sp. PH10]|nr:hypothetical protein A33M_0030 [Rhodovulum sp. PH10]
MDRIERSIDRDSGSARGDSARAPVDPAALSPISHASPPAVRPDDRAWVRLAPGGRAPGPRR